MKRNTVGTWFRRLTSDESELEADSLSLEVSTSGATRADECRVGQVAEIFGKLRMVELQPCDSLAALVAELYDGTDTVELVWLGRRSIAGIEAGRTLKAQGRLALRRGHKAIYNPVYHLMPAAS